jgi:hypothetical protein
MAKKKQADEMHPKYDFSKAERGKFYRPLENGYKVYVKQSDRSETVNTNLNLWGEERLRLLFAERGLNWDDMTEEQREEFVDMLLHEK